MFYLYLCFPTFSWRVKEAHVLGLKLKFMFSACAYETLLLLFLGRRLVVRAAETDANEGFLWIFVILILLLLNLLE